ncbi:MAG TPA: hypothetical protein VGT40_18135 [Methylomirabilota bacterium]|nr:hypothetical protein [Methylomirabilota bacterium]
MDECPFMKPAKPRAVGRSSTPVYCRLPRGRVRVPSREDVVRFCIPARYEECPAYLAGLRRVRALMGLV